jgi:hypothetical protein
MPTNVELEQRIIKIEEALAGSNIRITGDGPVCPECDIDLKEKDIKAHQIGHYGSQAPEPTKNPEANARWKELEQLAVDQVIQREAEKEEA